MNARSLVGLVPITALAIVVAILGAPRNRPPRHTHGIGPARPAFQLIPAQHAEELPAKRLSAWLERQGYTPVEISLNKCGWLDVNLNVEGTPMLLMLDTGANNLNLHRPSAERAKLPIRAVEVRAAALGGMLETGITKIPNLSIGGITSPAESYVIDLAPVNAFRERSGLGPCDGVLGGSFLAYWSAIIDYPNSKLYLLDPVRKPRSPAPVLSAAGYTAIALKLTTSLLLDVNAEVNGKTMILCLDTGAQDAMSLDRSSAHRAGLVVEEDANATVQLGGALTNGRTKVEHLVVVRQIRAPGDSAEGGHQWTVEDASRGSGSVRLQVQRAICPLHRERGERRESRVILSDRRAGAQTRRHVHRRTEDVGLEVDGIGSGKLDTRGAAECAVADSD